MLRQKFDIQKAIAIVKVVLLEMNNNETDFLKLFKILYFAERKHLATYGRSIIKDRYIAMKDGPVPSSLYDILKYLRGDSIFNIGVDFSNDFKVERGHYVIMIGREIDYSILSESELECLQESITENKHLSFGVLSSKSHDKAWQSAGRDNDISIFDIAKAGGANDELLKYISTRIDNRKLV